MLIKSPINCDKLPLLEDIFIYDGYIQIHLSILFEATQCFYLFLKSFINSIFLNKDVTTQIIINCINN